MPPTSTSLPTGKLPANLLAQLISTLPIDDPHLLLGPGVGEDAAVIEFGKISSEGPTSSRRHELLSQQDGADTLLAAKSDPITFATDEIGYYAVNVCANDLAVCGARPRFYLPTVLLPEGTTEADVRRICDQTRRCLPRAGHCGGGWAYGGDGCGESAGRGRDAAGRGCAAQGGAHGRLPPRATWSCWLAQRCG